MEIGEGNCIAGVAQGKTKMKETFIKIKEHYSRWNAVESSRGHVIQTSIDTGVQYH